MAPMATTTAMMTTTTSALTEATVLPAAHNLNLAAAAAALLARQDLERQMLATKRHMEEISLGNITAMAWRAYSLQQQQQVKQQVQQQQQQVQQEQQVKQQVQQQAMEQQLRVQKRRILEQGPVAVKSSKKRCNPWTREEDELLRAAVASPDGKTKCKSKTWIDVSKEVTSRSASQCQQRWNKILAAGIRKGKWSSQEDKMLCFLVQEHINSGTSVDWKRVQEHIPGRLTRQCRERWTNFLSPSLNRRPWTEANEHRLMRLFEEKGPKWAEISRFFDGRSPDSVKTKLKSLLREAEFGRDSEPSPALPLSGADLDSALPSAAQQLVPHQEEDAAEGPSPRHPQGGTGAGTTPEGGEMLSSRAQAMARAMKAANTKGEALVLYDGLCNVCNKSVKFVLPRVKRGKVVFASLQSQLAQDLLKEFDASSLAYEEADTDVPTSSLVVSGGKVYSKTDGSVQLLQLMGGAWPVLGKVVAVIPSSMRNTSYDRFAKARFKLFGGSEQVQAIPEDAEELFLDTFEGIHACPLPRTKL
ncbi:Transcription factor MYB3R-4 (Myb-related protein 3R-4) (Protein ENHANCED DEFECTIVE CYTOKINESIS) [Durusdinium trenchii]|uniref:Transcription factor MYB3R-4 (Myb-related protein 3R-4) (Protein ENHANCED DEFECTIVE CYTOKINESIS) n=1 Tax=Durusdinium trenchii TaxID=1381693 RepID=A0ABP0R6S7_9DINO